MVEGRGAAGSSRLLPSPHSLVVARLFVSQPPGRARTEGKWLLYHLPRAHGLPPLLLRLHRWPLVVEWPCRRSRRSARRLRRPLHLTRHQTTNRQIFPSRRSSRPASPPSQQLTAPPVRPLLSRRLRPAALLALSEAMSAKRLHQPSWDQRAPTRTSST